MDTFSGDIAVGQRWLSDTQSELGLGIVTAIEGRCIRISFPATGETRLYALAEAPLTRVELAIGERVRNRVGQPLRITGIRASGGLLTYDCERLDGSRCELPETELDDRLRLNRPRERLLAGRVDADHWFHLRHDTWQQGMREATSSTLGLLGARVALIPHQLGLAAEVAERAAPRVLLADEVGLGKTIEAGLIVHRMLLTGRAQRVLIVTPEPLVHQWLVEMRRRFNLRFALFDDERVDMTNADSNPFLDEQQVLCSLDVLLASSAIQRAVLAGQWDVLVVDEAHHLGWSETAISPEYALIAALAECTPSVLLLTATPEQLGRAGHFGRLRLLDSARFHSLAAFEAEAASYAPIAALAARLLDDEPLTAADHALLQSLLGDHAELPRANLIAQLLDRHGTGRVLFRNTRAAVAGFPQRQLLAYPLARGEMEAPNSDTDSRINWLIATLRELRPAKVLLICTHAETVLALREALFRQAGIYAAIFHEHMDIVERDRAAAYFAAVEDGTQILLCSEIGSEGRNFQFVHHLVLFDLPLEPDLLEQRIGRLDRIGQTETIRLHVPYVTGSAEEVLFRWYAEGLGAFEAICPAAASVYDLQREALHAAMEHPNQADALIAETRQRTAALNAELAAGRDRLLELHSHRPSVSSALVAAIAEVDARGDVASYMQQFWDGFGVEAESGAGGAVVVRPGAEMLHETFPCLPEDGLTATFTRSDALAHEDHEFLTWEHPMVRESMELLTASDLGAAAITLIHNGKFAQPTLFLEMLYVADCPAPPELQIGRFLPPTLLRLLLDGAGRDCADDFPHETLRGDCLTHNSALARSVIASQTARLATLIERGETLAQVDLSGLATTARTRMHRELGAEIERLTALALVNSSVRPNEIAFLHHRREQLDRALERVELRLDALRLVVMV
ncbi:RNA polymerase-binding ATPase [Chromatium weissei]|nr:RNA polymerase-binding ATPase [Chromatium weissei]